MYLSFGIFCEGNSDRAYLNVLVPRSIENLIISEGERKIDIASQPIEIPFKNRTIEDVANAACQAKDAIHLFFVHADTGGRGQQQGINQRSLAYCEAMNRICEWPCVRCVVIAPRHETEAWVMLDQDAVAQALGFQGALTDYGMPQNARESERLEDPKSTLNTIIESVRGRRRRDSATDLYPAVAGRQSFDSLRTAQSFVAFEERLRAALRSLGCLPY
jgi:hypothetical protein